MFASSTRGSAPRSSRGSVLSTCLAGAVAILLAGCSNGSARVACTDTLTTDAAAGLESFTAWLHQNHVHGAIGEVGWPGTTDATAWSAVGAEWETIAEANKLPVLMWVASEWLPASYELRVAAPAKPSAGALAVVGPQLDQMLSLDPDVHLVGVNDAGGEFGTPSSFSNVNPGQYGTAWHFDSLATLQFLAAQGIRLVRLPVRWERLQPKLGGALDPGAMAQLERYLVDAHTAGLSVILDVHNFGQYDQGSPSGAVNVLHLGSADLPSSSLADLWTLLAKTLGQYSAIAGWDIMNEPVAMPETDGSAARTWEEASQAAVTAIRATGDRHAVWVEGYDYSSDAAFATLTPKAWIRDPAHSVVYEAHAYFDQDGSGQYRNSYAADEAKAAAARAKAPKADLKVCTAP